MEMARSGSARPRGEDEARKVYGPKERRTALGTAFDSSLHCMTLAYEHPDAHVGTLLAHEAVMWSNLAVASALEGISHTAREIGMDLRTR
jgi:hypothetical protein